MLTKEIIEQSFEKIIKRKKYFCSEFDIRDSFAVELSKFHRMFEVFPEFPVSNVPETYSKNFGNKVYFDLVVIDKETKEKSIIEFKYKTAKCVCENKWLKFELANQNDTTFGRYDIWKDIFRMECFTEDKSEYQNGFLIFITNNKSYLKPTTDKTDAYLFDLSEGKHAPGEKMLQKSSRATFRISREYDFVYKNFKDYFDKADEKFRILCIEVKNKSSFAMK